MHAQNPLYIHVYRRVLPPCSVDGETDTEPREAIVEEKIKQEKQVV